MATRRAPKSRSQSPGEETARETAGTETRKAQRVFGGVFLLLVLLRFAASFFPKERLWGINYFAYLPMWAVVALTLVGAVCCVPRWAEQLVVLFDERRQKEIPIRKKRTLYAVIAATAFALVCHIFHVPFAFLGDGAWVLTEITRWFGLYGINDPISFSRFVSLEPLTVLINGYTAKWLYTTFGLNTVYAFWILGPIAGGFFVLVLWKFVKMVSDDTLFRIFAVATVLSCGGILLFFGYVEDYTYVTLGVLAYCYIGIRYVRRQSSLWAVAIVLGVSIALHYMAICLIPSTILLFWMRKRGPERPLTMKQVFIGVAISALLLFGIYLYLVLIVGATGRILIPFRTEPGNEYTLLSPWHLADLGNELLLSAPIGILLLIVGFVWYRKQIGWGKPEMLFLFVTVAYFLLMTVSLNSLLGMARDWDIFSVVGLLISLWALCLWKEIWGKQGHKFIVAATVGVGMTGLIGWVGVNVSPERASTRFKDILRMDEECVPNQNVAPGYENLRKYYQQRRLESEEYGVIQKLIEYTKGNPGEYDKLLMFMTLKSAARYRKPFLDALDSLSVAVQHSKQRLSKGEDTLSWAAKERFLFDAYCRFLIAGRVFYDIDIQQQGEMLKAGLPTLPYGYEVLGWHYSLKEEDASALKGFEASYGMDSIRINTLLGLGMTYCRLVVRNNATNEQLQKFASAGLYCFERALAIQPKPWLLMDHQVGYLYLWLGQYAKAREYFQRYLKGDSSSTSAQWVKSQLSELDRSGR